MADPRVGEVFAGYRLERVLGRGGMGTVYLARHPRLPRSSALKLLDPEMFADNEIRARFEREADIVARLEHPNIIVVHDRGVECRYPWIAMQYVAGTDAASVGVVDVARAVRIIGETAAALDYAHRHGVLHRDVKPANILLANAEPGEPERALLADFGIARLRDDVGGLTRTGTFTATLAFASPEQLAAGPVDHRCDQYSLACTLFALLTGGAPFAATNPVAVIEAQMRQPPPPLSRLRPDLPPGLDTVLYRALAKRPDERYDSCGEFVAAVVGVLQSASALTVVTGEQATAVPTVRAWQSRPALPTVMQRVPPSPPVYGQHHPMATPQANPLLAPQYPMQSPLPAKPSKSRRWVLIAAPVVVVVLAVTGFVVYRKMQPTYPTVSTTAADVTSAFPPELSASSSQCVPKSIDVDNGHDGRMNAVEVTCRIVQPASLASAPAGLYSGIFDAFIDSKASRDVIDSDKDLLPSDDHTIWNSDKSAELGVNNATQATYINSPRMLVIHFGFERRLTADQIVAFAKATGLL
ncbi:protein kinase [Nocardia sp. NPDC049707]|uniref:serine/threonine-protein kinase n=1 Tax=Nocardia sp. NPDC049707 TaxID=3154735 RepID=UPI003442A850